MPDVIHMKIPDSFIGFGAASKLAEIASGFGAKKLLIATDAGIAKAGVADKVTEHLKGTTLHFDIYTKCEPEPSFTSVELLCNVIRNGAYDLIAGLGGGSVMDATKVVSQLAPNRGLTLLDLLNGKATPEVMTKVLMPTTAGTGSEWSDVAVLYDDKDKKGDGPARVHISVNNFANAVIIDPELAIDLPQKITADTGMDALTHAIEAFTSPMASEISDMYAGKAIGLVAANLCLAFSEGKNNPAARYNMSVAASLAMSAAVMSSLGMAHFASKPLGKKGKLSHGTVCTLILPQVMRFNAIANPAKFARIAEMMGEDIQGLSVAQAVEKAIGAVTGLAVDIGMRLDLTDLEYSDEEIESMAHHVFSGSGQLINATSSRAVTEADIRQMYQAIIRGTATTI